jgi:hypothetical protein
MYELEEIERSFSGVLGWDQISQKFEFKRGNSYISDDSMGRNFNFYFAPHDSCIYFLFFTCPRKGRRRGDSNL